MTRNDGTAAEDKWFKAAQRSSMIYGNSQYPGGVAAWLPSLVLLVGKCMLDARGKVSAASGAAAGAGRGSGPIRLVGEGSRGQSVSHPRGSIEALMVARYGNSLAKTLLLLLCAYDAYYRWRRTLDLRTTDQPDDKER
eukprot:3021208-Pleurochrysis_carterae.AAC.1